MFRTTLFLVFTASLLMASEMPLTDYETVAASQSQQVLGPVGGAGDILEKLVVVPADTTMGNIYLNDGAGSSIYVHRATGTVELEPFTVHLGMRSVNGAWKVTTGTSVSVIGIGRFK